MNSYVTSNYDKNNMNEIQVLENHFESVKKLSYRNKDDFKVRNKKTEIIRRDFFGEGSHYLKNLQT